MQQDQLLMLGAPGASGTTQIPRQGVAKSTSARALYRPTPAGFILRRPASPALRHGPPNLLSQEGKRAKQLAENGAGPSSTKPAVRAVPGSTSMTLGSPFAFITGSFEGIDDTGSIPPDGSIAAGPSNLVHYVNDTIDFYSKAGTVLFSNSFSGLTGFCDNGDPRVVFNPYVQRFFATAIGCPMNHVVIAISNSSDATQGWHSYSLDVRPQNNDNWCDYPSLGFSAVATYVSCNMFTNISNPDSGSFNYAAVNIFDTNQLVAGGGLSWWIEYNFQNNCFGIFSCAGMTIQPAREFGANSGTGEFLIWARGQGSNDDHLEVVNVNNELNCCNGVGMSGGNFPQNNIGVGSFSPPPSAPQPFGVTSLDTGDTRLLSAFWQNGHLAVTQNTNVSSLSRVIFTQLNVSGFTSMSTINDWYCCADSLARYYGAVDANNAENMIEVYSESNSGTFVSAAEIGIPNPGSCTGCFDFEAVMASGGGTYNQVFNNRNRWGDYFGVSRDPDGTGIWGEAEYARFTDFWGNIIGFFYENSLPNPVPVAQFLSPSSVQAGTTFSLDVFGFDFASGAVVLLNGVSKPTTFFSTTHLSASISGTDIPNSGNYSIQVFNPSPQGGFSNLLFLNVTPAGPPTNDNYSGAITFNTPFATAENTTGATSSGDPTAPCGAGSFNSHSVWFVYTASVSGTLTVSTAGSSYDTVLSSWTGGPGTFVNVACDDDFGGNLQSQISFHVNGGTTYSIMVQSFSTTGGGNLDFTAVFDPDNDSWTSRFNVGAPTYHAPAEDTTQTITGAEDPATSCGFNNSHSVWFNYTPTTSGMVFASAQGSSYDTVVSVYTGTPGFFVQQACNDDFYTLQSMTPFYALAGTPYSIMVQSFFFSAGGNLLLTMNKQDLLPSPASVSFTIKQPIGTTSAAKNVTIKNQNSNTIHINSVTPSGNFGLGTNTCTGANIPPGGSCTLGVVFSPTNPGALKGSITVVSGANNSTLVINTSGTAVYPLDFTVASVAFPVTPVGSTSAIKTATLTNYTSAAIPLGTRSVSADFSSSDNCPTSLGPLSSCVFNLRFTPNRPVATTGVVTLAATTSPQPLYLGLTGTGSGTLNTHVTVTASLSFVNTFIGLTSATKTATLKNIGTGSLTINSFTVSGPFSVTGGTCTTLPGGVLAASASCTYIANFSPNAVSAFKGALVIRDTDPTARQIVALVGNGISAVTFSKASLTFGSVLVGRASAGQTVTITNNTSAGITSFGLTASGDFGVSATDCPIAGTLAAHAVCHATVFFQPITQGGSISGSMAVSGSQLGTPQLLLLSGIGN